MPFLRSITNRLKLCDAVEQAILNHGQRVDKVLRERFAGALPEGMGMPDFWQLQLFLRELLRWVRVRLSDSERKHVDELAGDSGSRQRRDRLFSELGSAMLGLRDFFAGIFQPESIEVLGFPSELGRTPAERLRQGEHLVEHLTRPELELPPARFGEVQVDAAALVEPLGPVVAELRAAIEEVGREVKLAEATQTDRDRAVKEHDAVLLWVARTLEALYRLAGEEELADRVRPATRRRTVARGDGAEGAESPEGEGSKPEGGERSEGEGAPPPQAAIAAPT